jgi:hypothetical protein
MMNECTLCRSGQIKVFFRSRLEWAVRSDWTLVPAQICIYCCDHCGYLFKSPGFVETWSDYQNYHLHTDSGLRDKRIYSAFQSESRSQVLATFLAQRGILHEDSDVLDYGCNLGTFLSCVTGRERAGYDLSEKYRMRVEALGCDYYTPESTFPERHFDLLTLIHVTEHFYDAPAGLREAAVHAAAKNTILIQVPDVSAQITDCYIADHGSHFMASTLANAAAAAGMTLTEPIGTLIGGELTGVFSYSGVDGLTTAPPFFPPDRSALRAMKNSLLRGEERLCDLKRSGRPVVIFGAGLLGTLLAGILEGQVTAFADDDESVQGTERDDIPVRALADVGPESTMVVIAVPQSAAENVNAKCRAMGKQVVNPWAGIS